MIDLKLESVNQLLSLSRGAGFNPHLFTDTNTMRHSHITVYLNEKALQGSFDNLTNATWRVNVQHKACEFEAGENDELHPVSVVASGMIVMTKKEACRFLGQIVRNRILKARVHSNHSGRLTLDFLPFEPIDIERLRVKGGSE